MDLLKAEMARKRKALQLAKEQTRGTTSGKKKKRQFLKAGQLKQFMEEQEEKEGNKEGSQNSSILSHKGLSEENQPKKIIDSTSSNVDKGKGTADTQHTDKNPKTKLRDSDKTKNERSESSQKESSSKKINKKSISENLSLDDMMLALRSMGLPIRLFGEDLDGIRQRLDNATQEYQTVQAGKSEQRDFLLEKQHRPSSATTGKQQQQQKRQQSQYNQPLEASGIQKQQRDTNNQNKKNTVTNKQREQLLKYLQPKTDDDGIDDMKLIYRFFKALLVSWELDLEKRPEEVCRSSSGQREMRTFRQCQDYIRPLFQKCQTNQLEDTLTAPLKRIVDFARCGEFVKAHDAYMDVAIGRSAWPIGVTMVGIHARSGRAKIESANVAHVMNSELQRKYLTSIKRLLSYYQNIRTDVPPSKKVLNT